MSVVKVCLPETPSSLCWYPDTWLQVLIEFEQSSVMLYVWCLLPESPWPCCWPLGTWEKPMRPEMRVWSPAGPLRWLGCPGESQRWWGGRTQPGDEREVKTSGRLLHCHLPHKPSALFSGTRQVFLHCSFLCELGYVFINLNISENGVFVLKCPYYGFLKMSFHAVCNSSKWMKTSCKVLNLKVHCVIFPGSHNLFGQLTYS